ncbi:NDxxF motif lipoprotein [Rossellomorea marisflavi]|uniref:NDxxF motif lipoprotein n=1 Tax=Rossellomorea marisflavi TaxID=189381 RepID=A0A5D4RPB1_9BACI|nr:NDxxF motif lipoprotein [Rossellomorea marisflavi]TYS53127.1 NDxxF motif lipoprotein [Rossellomorea marisflavi]WJV19689.1 NDxxF motif lipoprotein [Rossellomorea marisflavi]
MKKTLSSVIAVLLVLCGCQQAEPHQDLEDEPVATLSEVEVPDAIFTSDRKGASITEDEIKSAIILYLNSSEDLDEIMQAFEESIYSEEELTRKEMDKVNKTLSLIEENDQNFSDFITSNFLPPDYAKGADRISQYITDYNDYIRSLDKAFDRFDKGEMKVSDLETILGSSGSVNGREQKKIEDFLREKDIQTRAFQQ